MAKALTKSQLAAKIAEKANITKKAAGSILELIADIAHKEAKNSITLPGLGKLELVRRKARRGKNPATGEAIKIPEKKIHNLRAARAAKDATPGKKERKRQVTRHKKGAKNGSPAYRGEH